MKEVSINDLHWHDSKILEVVEIPSKDTLIFTINYPVDWEAEEYQKKKVMFSDFLNYSVSEIPFSGSPTILDVNEIESNDTTRTSIQIETNAGTRKLSFKRIESDA